MLPSGLHGSAQVRTAVLSYLCEADGRCFTQCHMTRPCTVDVLVLVRVLSHHLGSEHRSTDGLALISQTPHTYPHLMVFGVEGLARTKVVPGMILAMKGEMCDA